MTAKTKVIGYVRVSTTKQAESGLSLEAQQEKIESYAKLYDLELVSVVVDAGVSAKTLDRDGLNRAFEMMRAGKADSLLVVKLDRLTRSVKDLGALVETYFSEKSGYSLLSVSDHIDTRTAAGRLVLNVLASVSQWEREATGERTSEALKAKYRRGEYCGGRLRYGYENKGGQIVRHEKEQEALALARRLKEQALSYRAIAEKLEAEGFVNRKGNRLSTSVISNMLKG